MRLEVEIALLFALDMLETFSRQDFGLVLTGVRKTSTGRELDRILDRWRQQQIITRIGRGRNVQFRITDKASGRVHGLNPSFEWDRGWDGKWRVFSFDLPLRDRKERMRLWRHLHGSRFGFLQRSVWIWPHDVESSLRDMVEAHGIPECFCGFEVGRLFLCENPEVVASAWDWKQIKQAHDAYLRQGTDRLRALSKTDHLQSLLRIAQLEHCAYREAFRRDPLLPRVLWPDPYLGTAVQNRHNEIQTVLRDRIRQATGG
jgi:phenylacetic acid degradation operon negative regulatory protein